jgi:hypothetical protein
VGQALLGDEWTVDSHCAWSGFPCPLHPHHWVHVRLPRRGAAPPSSYRLPPVPRPALTHHSRHPLRPLVHPPVPRSPPPPRTPQEIEGAMGEVVRAMLTKMHEKSGAPVKRQDLVNLITVGGRLGRLEDRVLLSKGVGVCVQQYAQPHSRCWIVCLMPFGSTHSADRHSLPCVPCSSTLPPSPPPPPLPTACPRPHPHETQAAAAASQPLVLTVDCGDHPPLPPPLPSPPNSLSQAAHTRSTSSYRSWSYP